MQAHLPIGILQIELKRADRHDRAAQRVPRQNRATPLRGSFIARPGVHHLVGMQCNQRRQRKQERADETVGRQKQVVHVIATPFGHQHRQARQQRLRQRVAQHHDSGGDQRYQREVTVLIERQHFR